MGRQPWPSTSTPTVSPIGEGIGIDIDPARDPAQHQTFIQPKCFKYSQVFRFSSLSSL
jgi:hypothetical protein